MQEAYGEAYGAASSDEEELGKSGGRPRLHDRVRTLKPRGVWPTCITITPDDAHLVSGAWPNTIQVWRLGDGRLVRTLGIQVWGFEDEQGYMDQGMKKQGPTYKAWHMRSGRVLALLAYYASADAFPCPSQVAEAQ